MITSKDESAVWHKLRDDLSAKTKLLCPEELKLFRQWRNDRDDWQIPELDYDRKPANTTDELDDAVELQRLIWEVEKLVSAARDLETLREALSAIKEIL